MPDNITSADGNTVPFQYMAAVGHELRNTLMPIVMLSELLINGDDLDDSTRQGLKTINASSRLASRLIDDLLNFSRMKYGRMDLRSESIDLHDTIHNALESVDSQMKDKSMHVVLDLHATRHQFKGDPERMLEVFFNVLQNAVKYSNNGGTVTVRTCDGADGRLCASITDDGMGIHNSDLPHLFEPFFQSSQNPIAAGDAEHHSSGLGLGLAISSMILKHHGGTLTASSNGPGQGATFRMLLPLIPAATERHDSPGTTRDRSVRPSGILQLCSVFGL